MILKLQGFLKAYSLITVFRSFIAFILLYSVKFSKKGKSVFKNSSLYYSDTAKTPYHAVSILLLIFHTFEGDVID